MAVSVKLPEGTTSATLDQTALDKLTSAGAKSMTLNFDGASMTFSLDALIEIIKQSVGTVIFSVMPATLTGDATNASLDTVAGHKSCKHCNKFLKDTFTANTFVSAQRSSTKVMHLQPRSTDLCSARN